ncbi:hypothetical protein CQW23_33708 [Capsicum baccatum]|uniref:DNA topoisomerase n=1 Tax=Capsicum baccatum TaxID=33114 RepID=A0A2G2V120_CAPBA|nr:hypothetical protein CQW23_33708 [Capsicum baccatum]
MDAMASLKHSINKVASSALGFGPKLAMQLAERLYTQAIHVQKARHILLLLTSKEHWCIILYLVTIISQRQETDAGDHPPITPMCSANDDGLGNDAWKLTVPLHLPAFSGNSLSGLQLYKGNTSPPYYRSESELISLMEKHGIGTDASISVHINNICERNYVQVQAGRRLFPTPLGISLIRGCQCIDSDLCLPDIRSFIEHQIDLVAKACPVQKANRSLCPYCYNCPPFEGIDAFFGARDSSKSGKGVRMPCFLCPFRDCTRPLCPSQNAALQNEGATASFPCPKVLIGFLRLSVSVLNVTQLS